METIITAFNRILFAAYFAVVFYIVFLARRRHNLDPDFIRQFLNITPGKEKVDFFTTAIIHTRVEYYNFYTNLLGNVLLFVPLPFFLYTIFRCRGAGKLLLIAVGCSLLIEISQYVFAIGVSDIDDLILNIIGAALGLMAVPQKRKQILT